MAVMRVVKKVFVYYTGGTIGLIDDGDAHLRQGSVQDVRQFIINHIQLHQEPAVREDLIQLHQKAVDDYFVEEWNDDSCKYSILFKLETVEAPVDSTEMSPDHWFEMAQRIQKEKSRYDGFVILHGTNTMAYTSSALSFILMDLKKPVILTGGQRSLFHPRSNAMDNLIGALVMAGCLSGEEKKKEIFQQVMLFDNNKLFQGNRVCKFDCQSFHVFDCPNAKPLAYMDPIMRVPAHTPVCVKDRIEAKSCPGETPDVRILRLFPGIQEKYVRSVLEGAAGVILESFGPGDIPGYDWLRKALNEAKNRKVVMLNCTQVYRGSVRSNYESSLNASLRVGFYEDEV
ncbi:60 kDa lysophospholipase-like [Sardina pilchardus]|uniref:60 kDa lysophospholipase-like n=1 Tax=Sardina pilchardus TaxID=27697 RepID=UPI002E13A3A5